MCSTVQKRPILATSSPMDDPRFGLAVRHELRLSGGGEECVADAAATFRFFRAAAFCDVCGNGFRRAAAADCPVLLDVVLAQVAKDAKAFAVCIDFGVGESAGHIGYLERVAGRRGKAVCEDVCLAGEGARNELVPDVLRESGVGAECERRADLDARRALV